MEYVIVGLANPGPEYEHTRHNVGRMVVQQLADRFDASRWRADKTLHAQLAQGVTRDGRQVQLVLPDAYMNRSGGSVAPLVRDRSDLQHLVVVHDDIDLPLGTVRIVFDRGAGGHNGVRSIEQTLKTGAFVRVRVGVLPVVAGQVRKPKGADRVHTFILSPLNKTELEALERAVAHAVAATHMIVAEGHHAAMRAYNGVQIDGDVATPPATTAG